MNPVFLTLSTVANRRPMRSATYHRLAAAPKQTGCSGAGQPTVLPTRSSLLRRALRSVGCAI